MLGLNEKISNLDLVVMTSLWLGHCKVSVRDFPTRTSSSVIGCHRNIKSCDLRLKAFRFLFFFSLSFFCLFYIFAAVIDLLLHLLPVKKILRKHHRDGQILSWSSLV